MQRTPLYVALAVAALVAGKSPGRDVHAEPSQPSQLGFLFQHHFGVEPSVLERHAAWVSESDLLVALQIERLSHRSRDTLIAWRRAGSSWDAITRRCGLDCGIYYVDIAADQELRGPYARPYVAWRAEPGADQRLSDEEVRELVLLRVLRDGYGINPGEVARRRGAGESARAIVDSHVQSP